MIYVDTSVALAHLLAEERHPPVELWSEELVCSRLVLYEVWTKLHAVGLGRTHAEAASQVLARFDLLDLGPDELGRALEPFPVPVRALDALHLASADFLRQRGFEVAVATYDARLARAAAAIGLPLYPP